jgi:hypothetical protein
MRQLLSGIAVAALLAAGLPAIAQAAADDHTSSGATMAPDSANQAVKAKAKHKRHGATAAQRHATAREDTMAEQLNQQELQQLGPAPAATSSGSSAQPPRQ